MALHVTPPKPGARWRDRRFALGWAGTLGCAVLGAVLAHAAGPRTPPPPAFGGTRQAAPAPGATRVQIDVLATRQNGATIGPQAESHATLQAGGVLTRRVATSASGDPDLCQAGFVRDPSAGRPFRVWDIEARVLASLPTHTTLALRWSRSRRDPDGVQPEAGDASVFSLAPGEHRVFDYVAAPVGVPAACANLVLRLLASPITTPGPQPDLTFDVWLVHEDKAGRRWVHQQVAGRAGQTVAFALDPLTWSAGHQPTVQPAGEPGVGQAVDGTMYAALGPDGFLDVAVRARRAITWGRGRVEGEGREELRCAVGEAVALLLPPPEGEIAAETSVAPRGPLADGVVVQGGKTIVDVRRFFAGSQMSLYVVVTRTR